MNTDIQTLRQRRHRLTDTDMNTDIQTLRHTRRHADK